MLPNLFFHSQSDQFPPYQWDDGDVIRTSGRSPNHATLTGLTPEKASLLLTATIPNPSQQRY